jgi:hypothetical protein
MASRWYSVVQVLQSVSGAKIALGRMAYEKILKDDNKVTIL